MDDFVIEVIGARHDAAICRIIRRVGAEFGAVGEGFGPADAEVQCMSRHYRDSRRSRYLVARHAGRVLGGCGIAPFGTGGEICELRKLFLLPDGRGRGIGKALVLHCLDYARARGYEYCYLDTLSVMRQAITLYERLGFVRLPRPLPGAVHHGCDVWMIKSLVD